jgi:hypothetical protein
VRRKAVQDGEALTGRVGVSLFFLTRFRYPVDDALLALEPPPEPALCRRPRAEGCGLAIALEVDPIPDDDEAAAADAAAVAAAAAEADKKELWGAKGGRGATDAAAAAEQRSARRLGASQHEPWAAAAQELAGALAAKRAWCVEGSAVVHESFGAGVVVSAGAAWIWVKFSDPAVMKKAKSKVCVCGGGGSKHRAQNFIFSFYCVFFFSFHTICLLFYFFCLSFIGACVLGCNALGGSARVPRVHRPRRHRRRRGCG